MKLKPYPKYRDSGVEWVGEIPDGWDVQKIKIFSDLYGRIGFRGYTVDDLVEEGEGAITLGPPNIEDQKLVFKKKTHISWEKFDESPEIKIYNGDILLVKTASVGKVAFVENLNHPATVNPQLVVFKKIKIFSKFFYYSLISPLIQNQILSDMNGGVVSTLSQENIKNYFCTIPSSNQQKQIVTFLDKKTSEIDLTIEKDTRLIELLKEKRTALINHVVTKGLDPKVKMKDSGVEWIGEIPEEWTISRFTNYIGLKHGHQFGEADFTDYGPRIVKITQLKENGVIDLSGCSFIDENRLSEFKKYLLHDGDVLMALSGATLGKVARIDFLIENTLQNYRVGKFIPLNGTYNSFIYYILLSICFNEQMNLFVVQTAQGNVGKKDFKQIIIPIPNIEEQIQISEFLDCNLEKIDVIIEKIRKNIELLEEYKKSLIHHAVTGKVDVREVVV